MVANGSFVLVGTTDGAAIAARVEKAFHQELVLYSVDGDLFSAGLVPPRRVDIEYSVPGDATYRAAGLVTSAEQRDGRVVVRLVEPPARVQARKFVRLDVAMPVRLALVGADRETTPLGTFPGNDLSAGGLALRVSADHALTVDDVVSCSFELPTRQGPLAVMTDATVVRRQGTDCGLAFAALAPRLEQAIVAAINWQLVRRRVA